MALSAISSLSIRSGLRSEFKNRNYATEEACDGFGQVMQRRRRNASVSIYSGAEKKYRDVRMRVQAADAPTREFRTIAQVNEAIRLSDSLQKALKLMEETKAAGFIPNEGTYSSLMLLCRRLRQAERALVIYEAMKQAKEPISIRTYNTLLSCCQQSFRLEDALRIKQDLMDAGVVPDVVTFTTLMDIVVKTNPYRGRASNIERLNKAFDLFKEMETYSVTPDIKTYNTLLLAACEANAVDKALELYQGLVKQGLSPTDFTFELLLKCLGSGGRLKAAIQVYNEARAAGISLQARTYNFLITACATAPQPQAKKAWSFFEEMVNSDETKPNAQTYIALITASSKERDNEGVMKAFKLMKEYGLTQSITTAAYNQILESASRTISLDDTFKIYEEMKKAGHIANNQTYECLMAACIRNKDFQRAETIKDEFKNVDVSRNLSVSNALIRAFGDAGKWEESLKIFRDFTKKGMKPNAASFANVFDACCPEGTIPTLTKSDTGKITITPGLDAVVGLYKEYKEQLMNYSSARLERLDIRTLTQPGIVVATIAWLQDIRENPPSSDLIVVTGNKKEDPDSPKTRLKRAPKRHILVQRLLKGFGLQVSRLDTLAMLTLTVSATAVKAWVEGPDPFADDDMLLGGSGEHSDPSGAEAVSSEAVQSAASEKVETVEASAGGENAELVVQIKASPVTEEEAELVVKVKAADDGAVSG